MNLLIADLQRLWARRITRFFPLILGVLIIVGVVIAYIVIQINDFDLDFVDDLASSNGNPDGPATSILGPIAGIIPLMGFVIGASFVGADLKSGMIEHLLTWEPRRLRLIASRILVGAIGLFVITVVLCVFFIAMMYLLATVAGSADGITGELLGDMALATIRAGISASIFFMMGIGLTILVGNSMGSIIGFVVYWFILEGFLLQAFLPSVWKWLPVANANAFANGVDVQTTEGFFSGIPTFVDQHNYGVAGLILLAWGIGFGLLGTLFFMRRDID